MKCDFHWRSESKDLCGLRRRRRITGGGELLSSGPLEDPISLRPRRRRRPNPLSYLRRLCLWSRAWPCERALYEYRCAAGPRLPARDSWRCFEGRQLFPGRFSVYELVAISGGIEKNIWQGRKGLLRPASLFGLRDAFYATDAVGGIVDVRNGHMFDHTPLMGAR